MTAASAIAEDKLTMLEHGVGIGGAGMGGVGALLGAEIDGRVAPAIIAVGPVGLVPRAEEAWKTGRSSISGATDFFNSLLGEKLDDHVF